MSTNNTPLDAPNTSSPKPNNVLRIFQIIGWVIEGFLYLIVLMGLFFKLESWEGASMLIILGLSSLMMFYMFALWAVAGSRSWLQGSLAVPIGIAMAFGLTSVVFRLESWEYGTEIAILAFLMLLAGLVATIIAMVIRYSKSSNKPYYWHILIRLLLVTLLTAPGFLSAFS